MYKCHGGDHTKLSNLFSVFRPCGHVSAANTFTPTVGGCWRHLRKSLPPGLLQNLPRNLLVLTCPACSSSKIPKSISKSSRDKSLASKIWGQDPFGSAGVHAACLKQWAPNKSVFRSLKGIRSKRSRSRTRPSPQVLAPTWRSLVSDGPRSNIFELQEPPLPLLIPLINRFRKAAKPPINNNVLASFAGKSWNHWKVPMVATFVNTFVTFLHLEPSSPNHHPRRHAKLQLWSCAPLAPSIFAEIYPGCYRSTAPRCAARQLFDFQASAITSDRLLRTCAEASCCMRKTLPYNVWLASPNGRLFPSRQPPCSRHRLFWANSG